MSAHPSQPDPAPLVSVAVVDRVLTVLSAVLHDRPIQALVAARLLVESGSADGGAGADVLQRGLDSIGRAAELSRDVMWAVDRRPPALDGRAGGDLVGPIEEVLARAAGDEGMSVHLDLDGVADPTALSALVAACHDVLAGAVLAGGHGRSVEVAGGGRALRALVTTVGHPRPGDDAWLLLAAARLPDGRVFVLPDGTSADGHTVALRTAATGAS